MNLYPAIRAHMGSWTYYIIRMTMREAAESVRFASEVWENRTLDRAIQRVLDEGRVKKEIVQYLSRQEHRFFSAIVVAALKGNPEWVPVEISDIPSMQLFSNYGPLRDTFGVLRFDGKQKYYALDGQHRLCAIKALIDRDSDAWRDAPKKFDEEEISVIVVVPAEQEKDEEFFKRYRRLFGNLNRYAKPTDKVTNIIMDEDDLFAILTRRLITDHQFFMAKGFDRVKTRKGKNLRPKDAFFTSLETLYSVNTILLASRDRRNNEWSNLNMFMRFRPEEETIEELYAELVRYWDALIDILPIIKNDPRTMRKHDSEDSDFALFWPIGQEVMARLARDLLDDCASDENVSPVDCLATLGRLKWEMHALPWRNLVLVPVPDKESWKIRNEERKFAVDLVQEIFRFQVGYSPLSDEGQRDLRKRWESLLLPALDEDKIDRMWKEIMDNCIRK